MWRPDRGRHESGARGMLLITNYIAIFVAGVFAILALYAEHRKSGEPGFSTLGIVAVVGVVQSSIIAAVSLTLTHQQEQQAAELRIKEMEKVFIGQARLLETQVASLAKQAEILANQSEAVGLQLNVLSEVVKSSQPFEFDRFVILVDVEEITEASSDLKPDALNLGAVAYFCTPQESSEIRGYASSLENLNSTCSGRVTGTFNNDPRLGTAKGRAYSDGLELEIPSNGVIVNSATENSVFHFQNGMVFLEVYVIKTDGSRAPLSRGFFERSDWAFQLTSGSIVYRFDAESLEIAQVIIGPEDPTEASVLRADFDPEQSLR